MTKTEYQPNRIIFKEYVFMGGKTCDLPIFWTTNMPKNYKDVKEILLDSNRLQCQCDEGEWEESLTDTKISSWYLWSSRALEKETVRSPMSPRNYFCTLEGGVMRSPKSYCAQWGTEVEEHSAWNKLLFVVLSSKNQCNPHLAQRHNGPEDREGDCRCPKESGRRGGTWSERQGLGFILFSWRLRQPRDGGTI